jgi:hypothetical protein
MNLFYRLLKFGAAYVGLLLTSFNPATISAS